MKKILAVSGGIDSVVMLHLFKDEAPIVAHFDHGIRANSGEDAAFVERLALGYGLKYEVRHAKLGADCSEAKARAARYDFLREIAEKYDGVICVAHHSDDVLESIVINLLRGTGWRGLAPMGSSNIERPLLDWRKSDIYKYATEHELHFRQDQTNTEDEYLRNRVREKLRLLPDNKKQELIELYRRQSNIRTECDEILSEICLERDGYYPKTIVADTPDECALEIMRHILADNDVSLTRPQLERCVEAIRNFQPNKRFSLSSSRFLEVGKYNFRVL